MNKTRLTIHGETSSARAESYAALEQSMVASRERIAALSEDDDQRTTLLAAFDRAQGFVFSCLESYISTPSAFPHIPAPSIDIGPEESVDVNWIAADRRLLLNFSSVEPEVSIAGIQRNGDGPSIQGYIDPDTPNAWIVSWLVG